MVINLGSSHVSMSWAAKDLLTSGAELFHAKWAGRVNTAFMALSSVSAEISKMVDLCSLKTKSIFIFYSLSHLCEFREHSFDCNRLMYSTEQKS